MAGEKKAFYDLAPKNGKGEPFPFSDLKGKVVLIVNVASKCLFAPQYKHLESLYREFRDRDFVVIGVPCNQFLWQEPGTADNITEYCSVNWGVSFPVLGKTYVNGSKQDPVYRFLKSKKSGIIGKRIFWNYEKFLVDRDGKVIGRWSVFKNPSKLRNAIEKAL